MVRRATSSEKEITDVPLQESQLDISEQPVNKHPTIIQHTAEFLKSKFFRLWMLRSVGNFLLLFALFGVGMTLGPALYYETRYQVDTIRGIHYTVADSTAVPSQLGSIAKKNNEVVLTPPDTYFSIVIPKIGAASRVLINVDPSNETEYVAALKQGVAHAKGSVFPGMQGTSFFFAHSTDNFWDVGRYNAVFYLLKDMKIGDSVIVYFRNYRYNYVVDKTEIIDPEDVSVLLNAQKTNQQQIVLQTCWPPGTTWKRLLVYAKPAGK